MNMQVCVKEIETEAHTETDRDRLPFPKKIEITTIEMRTLFS